MMKEICNICFNRDFGYCGLRSSKEEIKTKLNEEGDIVKCSHFCCEKAQAERLFRIKQEGTKE